MTNEELKPGMLVQHVLTKEGLIVISLGGLQHQCRNTRMEYIYCADFELEPYDVEYQQHMRELAIKKKEED